MGISVTFIRVIPRNSFLTFSIYDFNRPPPRDFFKAFFDSWVFSTSKYFIFYFMNSYIAINTSYSVLFTIKGITHTQRPPKRGVNHKSPQCHLQRSLSDFWFYNFLPREAISSWVIDDQNLTFMIPFYLKVHMWHIGSIELGSGGGWLVHLFWNYKWEGKWVRSGCTSSKEGMYQL